jgi:Zn-dependent peptidase ImmA (M78 family)
VRPGEAAAHALRAELSLPEDRIEDMRAAAKQLSDVVVVQHFGNRDGLDGAYAFDAELARGFILINGAKFWTRRRFTLAHELGHHRLGHRQRVDMDVFAEADVSEVDANAFAAEFLMPARKVRSWPTVGSLADVAEIAAYFRVSGKAMLIRLSSLGVIDAAERATFEREYDPTFFARRMPRDVPERQDVGREQFPSEYVDAVTDLYVRAEITLDAAAEALEISADAAAELLPERGREGDRLLRDALRRPTLS